MEIIKKLEELLAAKDKKIAELEKVVAEGGGIHHHYHYETRQPYSQWPYQITSGGITTQLNELQNNSIQGVAK